MHIDETEQGAQNKCILRQRACNYAMRKMLLALANLGLGQRKTAAKPRQTDSQDNSNDKYVNRNYQRYRSVGADTGCVRMKILNTVRFAFPEKRMCRRVTSHIMAPATIQ